MENHNIQMWHFDQIFQFFAIIIESNFFFLFQFFRQLFIRILMPPTFPLKFLIFLLFFMIFADVFDLNAIPRNLGVQHFKFGLLLTFKRLGYLFYLHLVNISLSIFQICRLGSYGHKFKALSAIKIDWWWC